MKSTTLAEAVSKKVAGETAANNHSSTPVEVDLTGLDPAEIAQAKAELGLTDGETAADGATPPPDAEAAGETDPADPNAEAKSGEANDGDGEEELPSEDNDKPVTRFYTKHLPEVEQRAITIKARNRDLSLDECLARAKAEKAAAEEAPAPENSDADGTGSVVQAIDRQIASLEAQAAHQAGNFDFIGQRRIDRQITQLEGQKQSLLHQAAQTQAEAGLHAKARHFQKALDASKEEARRSYPESADPDSELSQEIKTLAAELEKNGDSLLDRHDAPVALTERAYGRLAKKRAAAAAKDGSGGTARAAAPKINPRPATPTASGAARTSGAAVTPIGSLLAGKNLDELSKGELDELVERMQKLYPHGLPAEGTRSGPPVFKLSYNQTRKQI